MGCIGAVRPPAASPEPCVTNVLYGPYLIAQLDAASGMTPNTVNHVRELNTEPRSVALWVASFGVEPRSSRRLHEHRIRLVDVARGVGVEFEGWPALDG